VAAGMAFAAAMRRSYLAPGLASLGSMDATLIIRSLRSCVGPMTPSLAARRTRRTAVSPDQVAWRFRRRFRRWRTAPREWRRDPRGVPLRPAAAISGLLRGLPPAAAAAS